MNKEIDKIISLLKKEEIVILPTDTVYGLTGDATNINAIKKVNEIKKREKPQSLIILVSSIDMAKKYTKDLNKLEEEIINKYWPNRLTILLKKNDLLTSNLTANSPYVGVRMPNDKFLLNLIDKYGKPLLSTSANIHNKEVVTNVALLEDDLKNNVPYIYDAGTLSNCASTIIKVENDKIKILRKGILTQDLIKDYKENIDIYN